MVCGDKCVAQLVRKAPLRSVHNYKHSRCKPETLAQLGPWNLSSFELKANSYLQKRVKFTSIFRDNFNFVFGSNE